MERLYQYPLINGRSPAGAAMSPNGRHIVFGWNQTGIRKLDVWMMDFPGGEKRRILEANSVQDLPRQDDTRTDQEKKEAELYDGGIAGFQWSPDSKEILFGYKGRTWLMNADGSNLRAIVDGSSGMFGFQFSPDGKYLSYNQGQNLFRMDRKTGASKQLTFISRNGTSISGHRWSPDSKSIMVTWSDDTKMGNHVMMDFTKDRATVVNIRRMWNGDLSVNAQVGVIGVDGGLIKFVEGLPRYHWGEAFAWSPDSRYVAYGWFRDDFKRFSITLVTAATAKGALVYEENAPANYVTDWRPIEWTRDSKRILLGTDILEGKFANRSIISMTPSGRDIQKVYAESHDIGAFMRPEHSDRLILVTAARNPLTTEITIVEPDGKRTVHVVEPDGYATPKEFNWASSPLVSDDGTRIATLASHRARNNELFAVEPGVRRLTESQLPLFKKVQWANFEPVSFPGPDGKTIHGMLITSPNLDRTKRHPAVISNMYADSAKAAWAGWMENWAAMNENMVVLCVDFRSSWGYGGEFNSGYYEKMGLIDTEEAVSAQKYLASLSFVRPERVGVWGWSYGGYLTCMILLTKPNVFHAGVAVASVTDWKTYNEWYTRRRLGLVKDQKEIFEKTSPITYAKNLDDHLFLVHGMLDDNVLFQDTARLMQRLIEAGKYFDVMPYPRDDHGIGRDESRPHVMATIMRYLRLRLNE